LPFAGNGLWRVKLEAGRRPLSAPNNRNNSRDGSGGHETRNVSVKCGVRKRRHREHTRAPLCAENRRPKLWLKVHWQNYGYHGCRERGKRKLPRALQCSIIFTLCLSGLWQEGVCVSFQA
jgi:hypothetical protein